MHCGKFGILKNAIEIIAENVQQGAVQSPCGESATNPGIICSVCGTHNRADFNWCMACGAALHPMPCDYCRQMLDKSVNTCPYCGAPRKKI